MSQISPPIRILLAGAVLFLAAWMTVLKPKAEEEPVPAAAAPASVQTGAPATTDLGTAVESANAASANSDAANAAVTSADPAAASAPAAAPATATGSAPAAAPAAAASKPVAVADAGLPRTVASAIAGKKVLVMLFWNSKAADDRAVRKELRAIDRHKGKVKVHVASIRDVARYAPITRGVDLNQSPTVVVVDRKLQAQALVGYNDRGLINQAVSDAVRAR